MPQEAQEEQTKTLSLADLEKIYSESESADKAFFATARSNLLLIAGEHYNKNLTHYFRSIRDQRGIDEHQKLRLTKNHIQRISRHYCNVILSTNPGVGFRPKSESELSDTKSAELHKDVWQDAWQRYVLPEKIDDWVSDFVGIGECVVKLFYDNMAGPLRGYAQKVDDKGNPLFGPSPGYDPATGEEIPGEPIPDMSKPIFQGEMVFERVHGFNVFRDPNAQDMRDSPFLGIRKMVKTSKLKKMFPDKAEDIAETSDETFKVFQTGHNLGYRTAEKDEAMVKEIYYRPCHEYPEGFYCIWTKGVKLASGVLPAGVFNILYAGYEKIQTSPRGISPIKHWRPYQVEINRAASKMAENSVAFGDDKIVTINGSKVSAGVSFPGVRTFSTAGPPPVVMPGRDGSQYLGTMESNIREMYEVADLSEKFQEEKGQNDPLITLFKSAKTKRNFQRNIGRFERFLVEVAKTYLKLAKAHFDESRIIKATGRDEFVNIAEFKNSEDLNFQIITEPQTEDLEEAFGKQIMLRDAIQYLGSSLEPEMVGKLLQNMPFGNMKDTFKDLTINLESANNMILALDRGEQVEISQFDDPMKMANRLVSRMRQADFKLLDPQIQQMYQQIVAQYHELKAEQDRAVLAAKAGFIPTEGNLVTISGYFVRKKDNPTATQQVRLPNSSISWLIDMLAAQGVTLEDLEGMNSGQRAMHAQLLTGPGQAQGGNTNDAIGAIEASGIAGGAEGT